MKRALVLLAAAALLAACVPSVNQPPATPPSTAPVVAAASGAPATAWVQYASGGGAEVRALDIGGKGCPAALADGKPLALVMRAPATADFPAVCAAMLPAHIASLSVGGQALGVPVDHPNRILVLGDTGCRIKGNYLQACNDPKAWPFAGLSRAAAAMKPDLVLHLGDYLYRESPCPPDNAGCAGSPHGDNWASWAADLFVPAAPLLQAAPWIVVRGNHEDCYRAGPGFLRLFGPEKFDPAAPCNTHLEPYALSVGGQLVAVMDSASAADTPLDEKAVPDYVRDFEALKAIASTGTGQEIWLASHRPIWGVITFNGLPAGGNATMIKAAGDLSAFKAISLMLAGHIHTFEAINYQGHKVPPQIIAGHGGDNLDVTPVDLKGAIFQGDSGVHVDTGLSVGGFGFLMLTREKLSASWTIQLYDSNGTPERQCAFDGEHVRCLKPM
ncbi:MAG: metallophosphoesterase [Alphaproteobacteria bacterium]|nr:metallophosphoesterase [Alphaproteobacteria bacterium]MBL7097706.1 metallophosphoesterase [Alphaproteobacteria bacterium]